MSKWKLKISQSSVRVVPLLTIVICNLTIFLASIAAVCGLFWPYESGSGALAVTSLWGEDITLHGKGLYGNDTPFHAGSAKGTDAVTLLIVIPLGLVALFRIGTGLLKPHFLLIGVLTWIVYVYAGLAFGTVVFNTLFLIYVATYSLAALSLIAIILVTKSLSADCPQLTKKRTGLAIFLAASGVVTLIVWLVPLVVSLIHSVPPHLLAHYTGRVTLALDIGIITPACFLAAWMVYTRMPAGMLLAFPLLFVEAMLLPLIVAQTIFQLQLGVTYSQAELIGPFAGFLTLSFIASIYLGRILYDLGKRNTVRGRATFH